MEHPSRRAFIGSSLALAAGLVGCKKQEPEFSCTEAVKLVEADHLARVSADYIERSPDPARTCALCRQWLPPAEGLCGGCKLFGGPVHAKGTCRLFAPV